MIKTFTQYFGPVDGYSPGQEPLIECMSTHIHNDNEGFLFRELKNEQPVFVRKDQLFENTLPSNGKIYFFLGFAIDSEIVLIQPRPAET
jgi:hypothetical protein